MLRKPPSAPPVQLRPPEVARRAGAEWVTRSGAFRLAWALDDIVAGDGFNLRLDITAPVEILPDPAERTLFTETFGQSAVLTEDELRRHLEPELRTAAGRFAAAAPAEMLLDAAEHSRWIDVLRPPIEAVAFSCGVRVLPPFQLQVTSAELDRARRQEAQQVQAGRDAERRLTAARQTAELLREWQGVHAQWPDVTPAQLLDGLDASDQASAVTGVLAATPLEPARFWAVAGASLIRLDWFEAPAQPIVVALPTTLGPLRSVRVWGDRLLVGARRGVWVLRADDGQVLRMLVDPALSSEHGFSAAIETGSLLWASHREAGMVAWSATADEPARRVDVSQLGGPPAALQLSPGAAQAIVAVDTRVLALREDLSLSTLWTSASPVVSVLTGDGGIDVLCRDGVVTQLNSKGTVVGSRATVPRLVAACRTPWLWSYRLMVVSEDGALRCYGMEDDVVTLYATRLPIGRGLVAAGGKALALSADRYSLIGWTLSDGRQPKVDISLREMAHARLTDIAGSLAMVHP